MKSPFMWENIQKVSIGKGHWIPKSSLCAHILHKFVVLLEVKLSAKPQMSAKYGCIMHECGIQYLTCCTLQTSF